MDLEKQYGRYPFEEITGLSFQTAESLVKVIENTTSEWIRKDASIALQGIYLDALMYKETYYIGLNKGLLVDAKSLVLKNMSAVAEFYRGDGFKSEYVPEKWPSRIWTAMPLIYDDPNDIYLFLESIKDLETDIVLSLTRRGVEPGMIAANKLDADICFGFHQYKNGSFIGFREVELDGKVEFKGKRCLVVDNSVKTGRNMSSAFDHLQDKSKSIVGAAVYRTFDYDLENMKQMEDGLYVPT